MKINIYIQLNIGILLTFLGSLTHAEPLLNGLASHQNLGKEEFIAALYTDNLTTKATTVLSSNEHKRMVLKVTARRFSARHLNSMWIEGMAVNNAGATLTKHADNMVKFTRLIRKKLVTNDVLAIDSPPGKGVNITLNGVALGTIASTEFFNVLLRTWIGPVPLSSDFRLNLLQAGEADAELLARYEAITPDRERVAAIRTWGSATSTAIPNIVTPKVAVAKPRPAIPAISPIPSVKAPTITPKPKSAKPRPKPKAIESKPKPKPKKTVLAAKPKPAPVRNIIDVDELDEDEELPNLTAKNLLSQQLYHSKLMKWTYRYLKYPTRAQKRNQQGSVRLSVIIDREGKVKRVTTVQESKYRLLNGAAESAVKRASPYPPMPDDVRGRDFTFSLPIVFKMQ